MEHKQDCDARKILRAFEKKMSISSRQKRGILRYRARWCSCKVSPSDRTITNLGERTSKCYEVILKVLQEERVMESLNSKPKGPIVGIIERQNSRGMEMRNGPDFNERDAQIITVDFKRRVRVIGGADDPDHPDGA